MKKEGVNYSSPVHKCIRVDRWNPRPRREIMTVETYHFHKGTEMPFKFQDRWVAGATGFKDIQDAFRHLEWREARRRFAEIAEKYDLDAYGLPRRGTW